MVPPVDRAAHSLKAATGNTARAHPTRGRESLIEAGILIPARNPNTLRAIRAENLPVGNLTAALDEVRDDR